jgi:type IV pilus assembly protein PilB
MENRLLNTLFKLGSLSKESWEAVQDKYSATGIKLGEFLIEQKLISKDMLVFAYATGYEVEYIDLSQFQIDAQLLDEIPLSHMTRFRFLPISRTNGKLKIATADPSDLQNLDTLEKFLDTSLIIAVASGDDIDKILKKKEAGRKLLQEVSEDLKSQPLADSETQEQLSSEQLNQENSPIVRLVNSTIYESFRKRASDIHIKANETEVIIKYRIDGVLQLASKPIDKKHQHNIVSRIKVIADLNIAENRIPQDGSFRLKIDNKNIDFRVSIMPTLFGEEVVIRILDKSHLTEEFSQLNLNSLGFIRNDLERFRKYITEPYGMVLVTGPTGSGKTTTLYAGIMEINSSEDNIITIEDPVEYRLPGITQIQVNEKKGLTFARGLRSILRHDPDKIMVGEIRDAETAQIAVQSALTGHLVFTTVHANNAIDVIGRLINMGVDTYSLVSALNCVLAQRLVRTICPYCKKKVMVSEEVLAPLLSELYKTQWIQMFDYIPLYFNMKPENIDSIVERLSEMKVQYKLIKEGETVMVPSQNAYEIRLRLALEGYESLYEGEGCSECNGTGYHGRTGVFELLDFSDSVKEMILNRASSSEIKSQLKKAGTIFIRESAIEKVMAGITTLKEINRVTFVE